MTPASSVDLITESECTEIRSVTESESRHILFTLRSADMIGNVFLRLSSSLIHLTELSEAGRGEGGERELLSLFRVTTQPLEGSQWGSRNYQVVNRYLKRRLLLSYLNCI